MHICISFRFEIYESQIILKLHTTEWFQFSKRLLINACKNSLHFQKPAEAPTRKSAFVCIDPDVTLSTFRFQSQFLHI